MEESAPSRPARLSDAAADVGDTFEEMLLERLAQEDGRGWRAGPVVALPMDRLAAGHLGWMTTLSAPGIFTLGTIHLIVIPGESDTRPSEIPLIDGEYEQFDSVEHFPGPPRLLLLAYARDPVKKPDVQKLAHEVFERVTAELTPERSRRSGRS